MALGGERVTEAHHVAALVFERRLRKLEIDLANVRVEDDEPFISPVPYVAVYDDDKARETRTTNWLTQAQIDADLTGPNGYINTYADRIHFNRYTGVAMK